MAVVASPAPLARAEADGWRRRIAASASAPPGADAIALVALATLTVLAQPHLLATDTLISLDSASQYLPWYAFLGQSLRAGHVPGWNPATFSGTPFAANPLSGWTYLPAMVVFTLLPLAPAARVYLALHPLLGAASAYALARALGLSRPGAFVAGLAYANSGFSQIQNVCCFPFASVYAWLPVALLGAEGALRSSRRTSRGAWWGLAALGTSQIVAAWLGQGTYYAVLLVAGYITYRTLVVPPAGMTAGLSARVGRLLQHQAAIFVFGAALAAAGLLPRVEFNRLSNLAGGYMGVDASVGGLRPEQWVFLAMPGMWYAGASVLVLAAAAPLLVRGRLGGAVWYFGATSLLALILTDTFETPLAWLLYHVLPGFANLHPHAPERILTVAYLGPALLAGATISACQHQDWLMRRVSASALARGAAVTLVVVVPTLDLAVSGAKAFEDRAPQDPLDGIAALARVDLETYYQPTSADIFLQQHLTQAPARYFGFAPDVDEQPLAYTVRFLDPSTAGLEVNNHALPLGLQDVQGYDASHLRRYDAYLAALNGQTQNYHNAEVLSQGLTSPLLDLLDARYVIVPPVDHLDSVDAPALERDVPIYADENVRILENPSAFPRAWIVHAATQAGAGSDADDGMAQLASGRVDAHQTALLDDPPPLLESPADPELDQTLVTRYEADQLAIRTSTTAPGLLVLSEVYYPAWKAYVDDQPAHLYVADGALRAVAVPPGEHNVELRFESDTLRLGLVISSVAALLLVLLGLAAVVATRVRPPVSSRSWCRQRRTILQPRRRTAPRGAACAAGASRS